MIKGRSGRGRYIVANRMFTGLSTELFTAYAAAVASLLELAEKQGDVDAVERYRDYAKR